MLFPTITITFSFFKGIGAHSVHLFECVLISLDTYGKYCLNMSVFIMYETMYYMYVYTVRTIVFLFIILYNYEDLNKGKKALKKKKNLDQYQSIRASKSISVQSGAMSWKIKFIKSPGVRGALTHELEHRVNYLLALKWTNERYE